MGGPFSSGKLNKFRDLPVWTGTIEWEYYSFSAAPLRARSETEPKAPAMVGQNSLCPPKRKPKTPADRCPVSHFPPKIQFIAKLSGSMLSSQVFMGLHFLEA